VSGLHPLVGHDDVRRAVGSAAAAGELSSALLLHGPPGIGKQRFALWLGQLLLCTAPSPEPCGTCTSCRLSTHLEHPDLHWFFRLPRPKVSGGSDKLGEALEELRGEELAARRADPRYPTGSAEATGIYLAHVQVLRRTAVARPAMGSRKVFVVGDAEGLVPQEASPEAANALLKVLEEPPPDTTVILTAADPESLLPTMRSRMLPVRMRQLTEADVAAFLQRYRDLPLARANVIARLSQGSIGRALAFAADADDAGPLEEVRRAARTLLDAVLTGQPSARLQAAHAQAPAGARGNFAPLLEQLALWLRDLAVVVAGAEALVVNVDAIEWLHDSARRLSRGGAGIPSALGAIDEAARLVQFNINPQLAMNALLRELARELAPNQDRGRAPASVGR
jgi:DNA polymerase-3 subunit delta'